MSLYDRDYMRSGRGGGDGLSSRGMLWLLIGINVFMYIFAAPPGSEAEAALVLSCQPGAFHGYELLTAGFLHADFTHILFNMWGLYLFGGLVTPYIKSWSVAALYVIGVLTGNVIFLVFNWGNPVSLLGASGAVCAVMMAAAMLEPNRKFFMIFMPFAPLKTSTLVICYTVLEVLLEFNQAQGGVAHLAHLGGFVGGYIFIRILLGRRVAWDPLRWRPRFVRNVGGGGNFSGSGTSKSWNNSEYRSAGGAASSSSAGRGAADAAAGGHVTSAELDALLDKISNSGINSLNEYELARLKRAREEMRGGR